MPEAATNHEHTPERELIGAAYTALVDNSFPSDAGIRPRFVSNDFHRGKKVMSTLRAELSKCSSFDFSVAFVTRSGITPLLQELRELESRGIPGRILTTDYLAFSEPEALEKLDALSNIDTYRAMLSEKQRVLGQQITSSTQYADEFESPRIFSWMTRSRLTLGSPEVKKIINAERDGLDVRLFIKKSDSEGADFYYFGRVRPIDWRQTTQMDDHGNPLPIVNFKLELEHPAQDDLYDYFDGPTTTEPVAAIA